MNSATTVGEQRRSSDGFTSGAIDSDVHPNFKNGTRDLAPYVDDAASRRRMGLEQKDAWAAGLPGVEVKIPTVGYVNPHGSMRLDALPPAGGPPASDPEFVIADLLDRYDLGAAVLLGGGILGLGGMPDPELAAAFAQAYNRWLDDVWLRADARFKGQIIVAPQAPDLAVREIEQWAEHPAFVAVSIPGLDRLALGKRHYYPIYEAAQHYGLPVTTHPGGESAGVNSAMVAVGTPSYYMEWHCSLPQVYQAHVISLVIEGVFERFPRLKVGFVEAGFAWLPHVMWRMDKNWKGVKEEVPWLERLPSEYVVEHIRFTSQPMYEPPRSGQLAQMLDLVQAHKTVMFSTDYPHWDADDPHYALRPVPDDLKRRMTHDTPAEFYGL